MSDETVLVATSRLDESTRRLVGDACEHARVRAVFWGSAGPESSLPVNPSLLVAALPAGSRVIPEEVLGLATQVYQGLPILLLCGEPLVRNSVSLHGGRLTLLGQPLTREKVSARIRTAVAAAALPSGEAGASPPEPRRTADGRAVRVSEVRGREWWAGVITPDADDRRETTASERLPAVCKLGRHGVAGLVGVSPRAAVSATVFQQAALSLASGMAADRAAASLEAALGAEAAAVWFSPATFQWSFYSPRADTELWLYSPLRLPSAWRLGLGNGSGPWRTLAAASGDIIVMSAAGALSDQEQSSGELWQVAEGGGPALLDHFEARYGSWETAGATIIMELR
jgi:hypothetical protein